MYTCQNATLLEIACHGLYGELCFLGTPRGLDFGEIRRSFYEIKGVKDIHDLRVWSLSMDKTALSVHLAVGM